MESPDTCILMFYYMSLGEESLKTNLVVFWEDLGFSIEVGPSNVKTPTMNMWKIETQLLVEATTKEEMQ